MLVRAVTGKAGLFKNGKDLGGKIDVGGGPSGAGLAEEQEQRQDGNLHGHFVTRLAGKGNQEMKTNFS
jgi:hypothetical protein